MRWGAGFGLLAVSGVIAGCGGASVARPAPGAVLFAKDCAACHSLLGAESQYRQGGDLRGYRFSRGVLLEFAREMPVRHPLSTVELGAVVDYVLSVERRSRAR
jgi:mono/diheme cytochrome c family protein